MKRNNKIALVLMTIMLLSLTSAFFASLKSKRDGFSATGMATGVVNAASANKVSIEFVQGEANFGSGYVSDGSSECIIDTEGGRSGCEGFSNPHSLVLKNTGETDAKVSLANVKSSPDFDGGSYHLKWSAKEGACSGGNMDSMKLYTELKSPLNLDNNVICGVLKAGEEVKIDLRLKVTSKQISVTDSFRAVASPVE